MPTTFTHVFVAIAAEKAVVTRKPPFGLGLLSMGLAALPDLDTIGLRLGIAYHDFWGHRGMLHSLTFAVLASLAAAVLTHRYFSSVFRRWWLLWLYLLFITVSHPLLDAMTNGGLGVALFSPFEDSRYFLPFRPIQVSPIGLRYVFSRWGAAAFVSELLWVWLPAAALAAGVRVGIWAVPGRRRRLVP